MRYLDETATFNLSDIKALQRETLGLDAIGSLRVHNAEESCAEGQGSPAVVEPKG